MLELYLLAYQTAVVTEKKHGGFFHDLFEYFTFTINNFLSKTKTKTNKKNRRPDKKSFLFIYKGVRTIHG